MSGTEKHQARSALPAISGCFSPGGDRLYFCHDYEAAIAAAKRAIRAYPELPNPYRWLAAALGQIGRTAEAKEALEKAIAVAPAAFEMYVRQRVPWHRKITPTCSKGCARPDCLRNEAK